MSALREIERKASELKILLDDQVPCAHGSDLQCLGNAPAACPPCRAFAMAEELVTKIDMAIGLVDDAAGALKELAS